ncbi:hypothetical protein C8F01DRAFT_1257876 [Mycena amicta]|nr:hypothetical protein C8F01DRAFT_1257876 [Mycena amicta]
MRNRNPLPALLECFNRAPSEVWLEIAASLGCADLLRLSLAAARFQALLRPYLYSTMHLKTNRACLSGLRLLVAHPELCKYVRKLRVTLNCALEEWPKNIAYLDEGFIAAMISSVKLHQLEEFEWGGLEAPPDEMWATLRLGCRHLRRITIRAGAHFLSSVAASQELSQFANLTSFDLNLSPHSADEQSSMVVQQLCIMLTQQCPELQSLTLRLVSSASALQELDSSPGIYDHTFPMLRSLSLDLWLDSTSSSSGTGSPNLNPHGTVLARLSAFLTRHPLLENLSLLPYSASPSPALLHLSLASTALPRLASFTGIPQHLADLPHPENLREIELIDGPRPIATAVEVESLRRCSSLQSLGIRLAGAELFREVVAMFAGSESTMKLDTLRLWLSGDCLARHTLNLISANLVSLSPTLRSFTLNMITPPVAPLMHRGIRVQRTRSLSPIAPAAIQGQRRSGGGTPGDL